MQSTNPGLGLAYLVGPTYHSGLLTLGQLSHGLWTWTLGIQDCLVLQQGPTVQHIELYLASYNKL